MKMFDVDCLDIEELASKVHDAWWETKKKQGFHAPADCAFGSVKCSKCHPDMIPYEKLSEEIKEYDRVTVRTVLDAIRNIE